MKREPVGIVVDVGCGDVAERYAGANLLRCPLHLNHNAPAKNLVTGATV
jgi:hypothetical protein